MDCKQVRDRIAEDPARADAEVAAHVETCPACQAYAARAAEAERRIQQALRFDVRALQTVQRAPAAGGARRRAGSRNGLVAVAAACIAGLALWVGVWIGAGQGPGSEGGGFAALIEQHWYDEPESWIRSDVQVSNVALDAALNGQVRLDLATLGTVTYARSCVVAGLQVPHLVVQGRAGPVMLLLIPQRPVSERLPLQLPREGLGGRLLPHAGGSIAVMGEDGEALDEIERRVAEAVQWTI